MNVTALGSKKRILNLIHCRAEGKLSSRVWDLFQYNTGFVIRRTNTCEVTVGTDLYVFLQSKIWDKLMM